MPFNQDPLIVAFHAFSNMASNQYKGVRIFGSLTCDTILTGTAGGIGDIGIQMNIPASQGGAEVAVCVGGVCQAIAGAAITAGADLILSANNTNPGYVYPATSAGAWGLTGTTYVIGTALESAAAASQLISVLLNKRTVTIT
jgi:hypothetical protein